MADERTREAGQQGTGTEAELTEDEWRHRLEPVRFEILRRKGTEPAWSGELLHVDGDGTFRCAGCDAVLFRTDDKFDSGSGWPSFDRAAAAGAIEEHLDTSHGMIRTEITCARCGGHLGHVFPDGPTETGQRYCVNSLSLTFDTEPAGAGGAPAAEPGPGAPSEG